MNYFPIAFILFFIAFLISSCKDKAPVVAQTPPGYYEGTRNITGLGNQSLGILLHDNGTGRVYTSNSVSIDTNNSSKQDYIWTCTNTELLIRRADFSATAPVYQSITPVPINTIVGKTGLLQGGPFMATGTFTVSRK